jgi:hypothetical protein
MSWLPGEHSDQENLTWAWLRAVEWGRWPIFLSQPIAPLFLLFFPWPAVVVGTILLNLLWAGFVRYRFVNIRAAYYGAIIVRLKWVTCPAVAIYLYSAGELVGATLALLWPLLIFVIGALPSTQIGRIQNMFMSQLGYESTA